MLMGGVPLLLICATVGGGCRLDKHEHKRLLCTTAAGIRPSHLDHDEKHAPAPTLRRFALDAALPAGLRQKNNMKPALKSVISCGAF